MNKNDIGENIKLNNYIFELLLNEKNIEGGSVSSKILIKKVINLNKLLSKEIENYIQKGGKKTKNILKYYYNTKFNQYKLKYVFDI